mgnify:CR=1 FL=1|tara:strand:- start:2328 stop:2717 length:390 start_codon:yes stop_codon:yes gene_type:complete
MANTYKCVRLEPLSKYDNKDCVCSVVIGMTAESGEGESAYIDGVYHYPMGSMPTVAEFQAGANALVSQFAANQGWFANLDAQIESAKKRDVATQGFEAPEITVDTSVEPEAGSPAAPAEEESSEESSEE